MIIIYFLKKITKIFKKKHISKRKRIINARKLRKFQKSKRKNILSIQDLKKIQKVHKNNNYYNIPRKFKLSQTF